MITESSGTLVLYVVFGLADTETHRSNDGIFTRDWWREGTSRNIQFYWTPHKKQHLLLLFKQMQKLEINDELLSQLTSQLNLTTKLSGGITKRRRRERLQYSLPFLYISKEFELSTPKCGSGCYSAESCKCSVEPNLSEVSLAQEPIGKPILSTKHSIIRHERGKGVLRRSHDKITFSVRP